MLNFLKYLIAYGVYLLVSSVGMALFTFVTLATGALIVKVLTYIMPEIEQKWTRNEEERKYSFNLAWLMQFTTFFLAYLSGALAGLFVLRLWVHNFSWLVFISCVALINFWHTDRQRFSYATATAARLGYRQRIANHSGALTAFVLASLIINL